MKKPNLFIVGTPNAGTSSLHNYMNQHPAIFLSVEKEPHFFCTDMQRMSDKLHGKIRHIKIRSLQKYLTLFKNAKNEKVIGEASTGYMATFSEQLQRYYDNFPKSQIKVVLLKDLHTNPQKVLSDIFSFLAVDATFEPTITVVNGNKETKSKAVRGFLTNPDFPLKSIVKAVIPTSWYKALYKKVYSMNTSFTKREPMNPEIQKTLKKKFFPEVKTLSKMLKQDLVKEWKYA
ncbi:MAG: hypothetical protein ACI8Y7_000374 [Candidatus Woesearchaeota archaeon]|jgi:hypothetical protein